VLNSTINRNHRSQTRADAARKRPFKKLYPNSPFASALSGYGDTKRKGAGNAKAEYKHLAWALSEAACFCVRFEPAARCFYKRKKTRTNIYKANDVGEGIIVHSREVD
jgi:hypothetical protein